MFASSDFVVIGMAMLALAFFMWYAIAGAVKNRQSDQEPLGHRQPERRGRVKQSEV
jgi:hypothetical protein